MRRWRTISRGAGWGPCSGSTPTPGRIFEKYDVEHALPGGGGEYPVQDGFGWTNGVTRGLLHLYPDLRSAPGAPPL